MDRLRGKRKIKRDGWVRQLAIDMPQLTQEEIAKRFGLEQSTISRILAPEPNGRDLVGKGGERK